MSEVLNTVKSYFKSPIPKRLENFYLSEIERFDDSMIANLPGWDPEYQFGLSFSSSTIAQLQEQHKDWLLKASKTDECTYIPFSNLLEGDESELTDFLAINISQENCPVYYGDHETGEFTLIHKTLNHFLEYLDGGDVNPMEQFGVLYEKSQEAFFSNDNTLVINLLEDFFDKTPVNPAIPGPYMKEIPDALNLLACAYKDMDLPEKAIVYFNKACTGIFCRNAFLNRVKFYLISSEYNTAMEQCNLGLERFSDAYSTSFLNLYKGIINAVLEKDEEALACFALMTGDVEKSNLEILTPVAAVYTHITEINDFEMVFNKTLKMIQEME